MTNKEIFDALTALENQGNQIDISGKLIPALKSLIFGKIYDVEDFVGDKDATEEDVLIFSSALFIAVQSNFAKSVEIIPRITTIPADVAATTDNYIYGTISVEDDSAQSGDYYAIVDGKLVHNEI